MDNTSSFSLLLVFSAIYFAAAQRSSFNIRQGSSLTPIGNSSWLSPSGLFAFGFYEQAHSSLYRLGVFLPRLSQKIVVWTANRDDPPVSNNVTLHLTTDGRLILQQQSQGSSINVVKLAQSISSAAMLDSGNFVLYDSNQKKIWQSFDHPTDTILPGQVLADQEIFSSVSESDHSTGIFRLAMQDDSNLMLYTDIRTAANAYWVSGTRDIDTGSVNVTLNLDPDGHLYLLNNSGTILLNLTGGFPVKQKIYIMKIDVDGIPRMYSLSVDQKGNNSLSVVWELTDNKCFALGLCGVYSYCTINEDEANCVCFPGFDFVTPGNRRAGCGRSYIADSCNNKDGRIQYNMTAVENTSWDNDPYSVLKTGTREECEAACLKDCNCQAAFFNAGECRKQRLPFRYGKRSPTDSNIALIKWASQTPATEVPTAPTRQKKKETTPRILIISISLVALAFMVFVVSGLVTYRNRIWAYKIISAKGNVDPMEDIAPQSFTYAELEKVTHGFLEEIGRGTSGKVYKGTLEFNNKVVAVKRLENMLAEGEKEFQNEMKAIGRTHHRNLVRLLGYSLDGPTRVLVYEYMINGSLADILFESHVLPSWEERIRIALDIARGILYLHEECETQIIHCDIKPQNILIDEYRSAKISDFGLAKLLKPDQTKTTTAIRGTRGYVAPEWHRNMPVTVKADVYSFGIMLLEIICCRKCVNFSLPEEEAVLEEWVYHCFESQELDKLIVDEETETKIFERMVRVGLWCILEEPMLRPSMRKVLLMLEGTVEIPVPPSPTSYLSAI